MLAELPTLDMDAVAVADRKQTYWILYQQMKDDFVHKKDLEIILNTTVVTGMTYTAVQTPSGPGTGQGNP